MKSRRILLFVVLALLVPAIAMADGRPQLHDGSGSSITRGGAAAGKASRDTVLLIGPWGSGASVNGQFEGPNGGRNWNGWTHQDATQSEVTHWQVSDYRADALGESPQPGNLAAWCGDLSYAACSEEDLAGGYGNSWNEILQWTATVANPALGVAVNLTAYANIFTEPGYDYVYVRHASADGYLIVWQQDGYGLDNQFLDLSFSLSPEDYQGSNQDEVVIQFWFESDGAWSDEDCLWPTAGAIQVDEITVTLEQDGVGVADFTDFQDGLGSWEPVIAPGVGDFSQLWTGLGDLDPCRHNFGTQVAFIDDGLVVPGVGPTLCIEWCYGPGGYIVNTTGGRVGPDGHLHNLLESPVIPWPGFDFQGALYEFDVYRHELFNFNSPGIFYTWSVRSTGSSDPADIASAPWVDRNFLFLGGPDYLRSSNDVSDLLEPGLQYVQAQLAVYELGFVWGIMGNNGTPAPYFDNVRLAAHPFYGPGMSAREIDLAQDNFPTIGELDLANLGHNSVRFDMAMNIANTWDERNDPGDSIVVDVRPLRAGSDLVGDPVLRFKLRRNPLFDPHRTSVFGAAGEGEVTAVPASNGTVFTDRWAFDLPDSNFLFPGDILHYYIAASDDDGFEIQAATLPADTTGFSVFDGILGYNPSFTVRALPSVSEDPLNPGEYALSPILFWNDFGNRGGRNEWHYALASLGFVQGRDYDTYYSNGPSSGVSNGLGGRATPLVLDGYDHLLYSSGDLSYATLSDGSSSGDFGDDLGLLDSWLRLGEKNLLLTGDAVVQELALGNNHGPAFLDDWLGVEYVSFQLAPLINNQAAPKVQTIAGNGVLAEGLTWVAYGGCPGRNSFDAVAAKLDQGAIQLAEFLDPNDAAGYYPYSAATLQSDAVSGSRVISLPYDLMSVHTAPDSGGKTPASLPARAVLLDQILGYYGIEGDPLDVSPVPGTEKFAVRSYPNPFNPTVKIEYTMPRAGQLSLKVYNVRGQLVRRLIDERIETSGHVLWDGTDDQGAAVSSGVYFTEARAGGEVQVGKLTLIR